MVCNCYMWRLQIQVVGLVQRMEVTYNSPVKVNIRKSCMCHVANDSQQHRGHLHARHVPGFVQQLSSSQVCIR